MSAAERSVLHVLPHPGGGGETYVDLLGEMPDHRFSRTYLAASATASGQLLRGVAGVVRQSRRHDLLHVHGEAAAALCLPLLATRPSVVTLHGLHLARRLSGISQRAAVLNLRSLLRAADRTICVSQSEHGVLTSLVGVKAARRAVVVPNGVRVEPPARDARAEVRGELGIADYEPVAIWVGSLDDRKDPLTAVRAAQRASLTLLVVGDGPLRAEVERAGDERIRVLGQRNDVSRLLAAADLFVLTSHREGLSLALVEAMAAGLLPIVRELPENLEAVGDAGVVYDGEDDLVAAVGRLAASESERAALGERARERVAKLFSAEKMVARTRAVYDDVLGA
jgi:glycosyltransferase involved in cell wall biosynthesis